MHDGNVLRRLSPQDLAGIAGQDLALFFGADHKSSDNAVAQIGVGYAKDRSIRCASDHGKRLGGAEKLPPLHVLEEGEKKNDGMVRKMSQSFQQLAHRQVGQVGDVKLVLIRNEARLYQCSETSVIIGLPRNHEEVAGSR